MATEVPPATSSDVEIAAINAEASVAINETHAAVELARIEAAQHEDIEHWRSRATTAEAEASALTQEVNNLRSLNLQVQETASNLTETAEAVAEAAAELVETETIAEILTPPSTPEPETLTEVGGESGEPVEVAEPEAAAVEAEVLAPAKRRRIIV